MFFPAQHRDGSGPNAQDDYTKVSQLRLVNSSIQITLETYGHLFEGIDETAAERLDAIFLRTLDRKDPPGLSL